MPVSEAAAPTISSNGPARAHVPPCPSSFWAHQLSPFPGLSDTLPTPCSPCCILELWLVLSQRLRGLRDSPCSGACPSGEGWGRPQQKAAPQGPALAFSQAPGSRLQLAYLLLQVFLRVSTPGGSFSLWTETGNQRTSHGALGLPAGGQGARDGQKGPVGKATIQYCFVHSGLPRASPSP